MPELKYRDAIKKAIKSYNYNSDGLSFASPKDDPELLDRITVNYIRHELSQYDHGLASLWGRVGKGEAYLLLNKKIYTAISAQYPELKSECAKQMQRKQEINDFRNMR